MPGQELRAIRREFSHPRALAQCEAFPRQHGVEPVPAYDTAGSAKMLAERHLRGAAAIASVGAAHIYGLAVLAEGIETNPANYTKFLSLAPEPAPRIVGAKTSIVFTTQNIPGALYLALGAFATRSINLTKLESRPRREVPWEYLFYVDFEGHQDDPPAAAGLLDLSGVTAFLLTLGSYPADVAKMSGLTTREAIELHSRQDYQVLMVGFAPGFPYLGIVAASLRSPRLRVPRTRVPAGSVGIADALTGVYPLSTPGGWRLIGRTPQIIYDPRRPDPILLRPGDHVRFVPVTSALFPEIPLGSPGLVEPTGRPAMEVRDAGLYTTVQDLGRTGSRSLGLPSARAMDPAALQLANPLVRNRPDAAAVECTAPGPVLRALDDVTIAVTGADFSASLDGHELQPWTPIAMRTGQMLSFGAPRRGMWAYGGVGGGIAVAAVLGSTATYVAGGLGGAGGRRTPAAEALAPGGTSRM